MKGRHKNKVITFGKEEGRGRGRQGHRLFFFYLGAKNNQAHVPDETLPK